MKFGLSESEMIKLIEDAGVKSGELISAESIRNAIISVVKANNAKIEKQVTETVSSDLVKGLNKMGKRL